MGRGAGLLNRARKIDLHIIMLPAGLTAYIPAGVVPVASLVEPPTGDMVRRTGREEEAVEVLVSSSSTSWVVR